LRKKKKRKCKVVKQFLGANSRRKKDLFFISSGALSFGFIGNGLENFFCC